MSSEELNQKAWSQNGGSWKPSWNSLIHFPGLQFDCLWWCHQVWTLWGAQLQQARVVSTHELLTVMSVKFLSSCPVSVCRPSGKPVLFLVILSQKGGRKLEMLVWRVLVRCLRKLEEFRIQVSLQIHNSFKDSKQHWDLLSTKVCYWNSFFSLQSSIRIRDNHKTNLFAK